MRRHITSAIVVSFILTLAACGSNGGHTDPLGGITAIAVWPSGSASGKSGSVMRKAPSEVVWVRMIVSKGTTTLQADFSAAAGSGSISSVPAGSGWTLTFVGLNAAKTIVYYEGSKGGITVTGGQTTNAGSVAMRMMPTLSGILDTTFSSDGIVYSTSVPNTSGGGVIYALAVQPDGKIVAAGTNGQYFGAARYLPNGALDTSCDIDGILSIPTNNSGTAQGIAIQSDGKIVVAGSSRVGSLSRFTLSRGYASDCTPDFGFGSFGIVTASVGTTGNNGANAIGIMPSTGDIIAAGYAEASGIHNTNDFAFGIFSAATGSLINSKTESFFTCASASCSDIANAVAIQPDGKIILAGVATGDGGEYMALARYLSNGGLDASFNTTGKIAFQAAGSTSCVANAIALQPDGKIVVGGYCWTATPTAGRKFALSRLNANGTMDSSFNGGNVVIYSIGGLSDLINAVRIQPDGKIVVAGSVSTPLGGAYTITAVARFLDTGATLDSTFNASGTPGIITGSFKGVGTTGDEIYALGLQSDGNIVVAGKTWTGTYSSYALARYWNDVTTKNSAYVANSSDKTVSVISLPALTVSKVISLPSSSGAPSNMGISPGKNRVYVVDNLGNKVSIIDTINNMVIGEITGLSGPTTVAVNETANRIYIGNNLSNTVSVIDMTDHSTVTTITVGNQPRSVYLHPFMDRLYVSNGISASVSVIDTITNTVIATIPVGSEPRGISVDPVLNRIFVANYGNGLGNTVSVIDAATNLNIASVTVGLGPLRVAAHPTAGKVYVANTGANTVSVINSSNYAVTPLTVGNAPQTIAIDGAANRAYIVVNSENTVKVLDTTSDSLLPSSIAVGGNPFGLAIAP